MKIKSLLLCGIAALCCTFIFGVKADAISDMRPEVLSSKASLPEEGQFNIIAEPFDWGKDVTRLMINVGDEVSSDDLQTNQFNVSATHWSDQAKTNDSQGTRRVLRAYTVDEEGNEVDSSNYVVLNLEYGAGVRAAHLGSYDYASYYSSLEPRYQVTYNGTSYTQHEVVSLILDEFEMGTRSKNGKLIGFGFYKPEDTETKRPLIIYFHGMGEGGADNKNCQGCQMYAYPECAFADKNIQEIMGGGAYVLLPQSQATWPDAGFTSESGFLPVVEDLIDEIIEDNPGIDTNRIYVGGLSMGGYMCSRVILHRPDFYAAAFPCSQAYAFTDQDGVTLKEMPIWISCCEKDGTCRMDPYTYASYQKLVNAGSQVAKCEVMEGQNNDPRSMFRFYSSDMEDFIRYEAVHEEHPNQFRADFVWENNSYAGHNGGWVPVFANGVFYKVNDDGDFVQDADEGNKITIMEWAAAQSLVADFEVDDSAVKKDYNVGDDFDSTGLVVKATKKNGDEIDLEGYTIEADTSKAGTATVSVKYAGIVKTFDINVTEPQPQTQDPNANNPSSQNPVVQPPVTTNTTDSATEIAKIKGLKLKKKGNKVVVTFKKVDGAKKYEVWCALKKNFKKGLKKVKVSAGKATVKKLKKGKKYYFKVRGIDGSKKGAFSAVKKIKL